MADDTFGPAVVECRQGFDFTLLFEQSILTIAPAALFLLCVPFRFSWLYRRSKKTKPSILHACKLATVLVLTSLDLGLVILWGHTSTARTRASIAAASISFIAACCLAPMTSLEHARSVRPSTLITFYLAFSALFDVAQVRTLWLSHSHPKIAALFTSSLAIKVVLLVLETKEKKSLLSRPYRNQPPESLGGILNRSLFWWLNDLFAKGYRGLLNPADLYEPDQALSSEILQHRARVSWGDRAYDGRYALALRMFACANVPLILAIFPRLCLIGFRFSQPLLINRTISLLDDPSSPDGTNVGHALIGATALIYVGQAISTALYKHNLYGGITLIRGCLVSLIYDNTLTLPSDATNVADSAAVTMMSTDVDRIAAGIEHSDAIWASPIEMGVALYLLYRQLGLASLVPVVITIGSTLGAFWIGAYTSKAQGRWVESIQTRVAVTSSHLSSIKGIKMMGLTDLVSDILQDLRIRELNVSKRYRMITTGRNALSNFSLIMGPPLTFAIYVGITHARSRISLDPANAFTSLSLIALISTPIQELVYAIPSFTAGIGCFNRIQDYLKLSAWNDPRLRRLPSTSLGLPDSHMLDEVREPRSLSDIGHVSLEKVSSEDAFIIENVDFRYSSGTALVLENIITRIPRASTTVIVGPIGCGKSTFLKVLLGAVASTRGYVFAGVKKIGYCAQDTWLPNSTIREAIVGGADYDEAWFTTILESCALDEDMGRLSNGIRRVIGSKGQSLSGGQRQRLALARALYSRPEALLLDDIFSGLDVVTEQVIFQSVLGPEGMCHSQGITTILVTHSLNNVGSQANIVVLCNQGRIVDQGTLKELKARNQYVAKLTAGKVEGTSSKDATIASELADDHEMIESAEKLDLTRQAGDTSLYLYFAKSVGWIRCLTFMTNMIIVIFSLDFSTIWLKWWAESENNHLSNNTGLYLGIYVMLGVLAMLGLVGAILVLFISAVPKSSAKIHKNLLHSVMDAPYSFFVATDTGRILNRFSQDMSLIDMQLPTAVLQTTDGALTVLGSVLLIATASKYMSIFFPFSFGILYILQRIYLRTSRQLRLLDLEQKSPLFTHFAETLEGLVTIRAFGWQRAWTSRIVRLLDQSQKPFYLLYSIQRWLNLVLDLVVAAFAILVVTLATQLPAYSGGGALGVALINIISLNTSLAYLIDAWTQLETSLGAIARVKSFESSTASENSDGATQDPPIEWPSTPTVEMRNLSATYSPGSPSSIRNISLEISGGQKIAIVGRSGSGKSSLLLVMLRLLDITAGTLTIDSLDITTLTRQSVRSALLAVPQDPLLLPGTVRFNLAPNSKSPDGAIRSALVKVGLWGLVEGRGGLDAAMEKCEMSQGQQQLFCLARVLLRRDEGREGAAKLVLLDEFAASVDSVTEGLMMGLLKEEFAECTIVAVTHRLESIVGFDRVGVMDQGHLVEYDRPEVLLGRLDSAFYALYHGLGGGKTCAR